MAQSFFLLFIFVSLLTAILDITFVVYSIRNRRAAGIKIFGFWMLACSGWIVTHLTLFIAENLTQALWALRLGWLFQIAVPPLYLLFTIKYKGFRRWVNGWRQVTLLAFPLIFAVIGFSDAATDLIWAGLSLNPANEMVPLVYEIGPVLWLFWAFAYACLCTAAWIYLRTNHIRGKPYQLQSFTLTLAAVIPMIMSVVFLAAPQTELGFNATPLSFSLSGVIIGLSIFYYRLFDLSPVVYHRLLESLKDGVLVVDRKNRLLQMNDVAVKIMGIERSTATGEFIPNLFDQESPWPGLLDLECSQTMEIQLGTENVSYYKVSCFSIDQSEQSENRLIIIEDITGEQIAKNEELRSRATAEIRAAELDVLRKVAENLNRAVELSDVIQLGLKEIVSGVGARFGYIILADSNQRPVISGSYQAPPILQDAFDRLTYCPPCKVFERFMAGEYQEPVAFLPCEILKELSISYPGMISIPLHLGVRQLGTLALVMAPDAVFTGDEIRLLQTVGDQLSASIERARLYEQADLLATVDSLTGLYNRRHFFQLSQHEFDRATRYNYPISILMIDIDFFKRVNDNYGHLIGDQALRQISDRFRSVLRTSDIIGRYGGDEFLVVMPETSLVKGKIIAERLRKVITDHPLVTEKGNISLTISLGVAGKEIASDLTLEQVLENADQALLRSKDLGRNKVHTWETK